MKRGKDEEKMMGPMFPRLHVNDTEKGGPRAPPRNKMALYEQLSIPSQRYNPGVLPLTPNNTINPVPPASASQGSGHERGSFFSLQLPSSFHPAEKPHTSYGDLNPSSGRVEQQKSLEEDDFTVPIFVQSGVGQEYSKANNSTDKEKHSSFSPAFLGRIMKLRNASEREPKQSDTTGLNSRLEGRSQSEKNAKEFVAGKEQSVKLASNLASGEKNVSPLKQITASLSYEHTDHSANNLSRLQTADDSLQLDYRADLQLANTLRGNAVANMPIWGISNGNSSIHVRYFPSEEHMSFSDPVDDCVSQEDKTHRSLQTGNADRDDDISENSMVDSVSGTDLSPDDVVGIIGQKHFWKARRAIVNQQRVFAVQVFELHRLIKVQRLIAESPQLLNEESAYLGKGAPAKKLPLEYIVKATPNITKHKDVQEKPNHKMEGSAENAVGKASLSSVQNASQSSTYRPISRMPPQPTVTADSKMGSWSYNQPPGHQWLIPVMSPSEGLVYKPYPGPGFMGPVCGGTPGSTPMMGNFLNYGVPPSHPHYQGLGVAPFAPPAGHGYFPPYGMPVMNPAMNPALSVSTGEQMNPFAGQGLHGQLSGGGANFGMQNQSSCNVPSQKNAVISYIGKSRASKDGKVHASASKESEVHVSTASSPSERAQGTGVGHTAVEGRNALAFFPTSPPVCVLDGGSQPRDTEQRPTRVIKVVPHNARSATESVARIFRSIQEERNQYESG